MNTSFFREGARLPILFLVLAAVLMAGVWGICSGAAASGETDAQEDTMTVIHATDLHYIPSDLTADSEYFQNMIRNSDGKVSDYADALTDAFLQQVIDSAPQALILSGDLTFNGERLSHEALAEKLQAVEAAGIPVLVMPGNHDLWNGNAARFEGDGYTRIDSVSADEFAAIYADYGFYEALSRDTVSLSYSYALSPTLRVIMLDVNTEDSQNTVKDETLAWLETQLADAEAAGAQILTVSHQNLMQHNSVIVSGYQITNHDAAAALYENYPVILNLTGHLHCQHIAWDDAEFCEIAGSSLAVTPNQYGVLEIGADTTEYHTVPVDVAAWAAAQGSTDENLLNFADYSLGMFTGSSDAQGLEAAGDAPDAAELAQFYTTVNLAYFAGHMDTIDPDDPLFDRWNEIGGFVGMYLQSTLDDNGIDFTSVTVKNPN